MDHPASSRPPNAPKPLTITKRAKGTGQTRRPDAGGGAGRCRPDPPPSPRPNRARAQVRRVTAAAGAGRAGLPAGWFRGLSRPPNEHWARKPGEPAGQKAGPTAWARRSADILVGVSGQGCHHAGRNAGAPQNALAARRF